MSIETLIFDVDGTLADTEETHRQAFNEAFCAYGLDWKWAPDLYAELLQVTGGKERIASYLDRLQLAAPERRRLLRLIPEIHSTKTRLYTELVALGRPQLRAGVGRLMEEARAAGIQLAIASTTSPENVESLITTSFGREALRWFSAIVTGDVVSRKKPAPDIYDLTLATLRVMPRHAVAFEDSAIGVAAAKAAGLFTVATPSPWTAGQDFAAADLVLPSLADPDAPLEPADEWRIGAAFLGLEQLATIHAAAQQMEVDLCHG
jgi:HAD superfamily hydrolase (TIGR01509 family)